MYSLRFKKSAIKALNRLPKKQAGKLIAELKAIAAEPEKYRRDWKPLKGSSYWRLRLGQYRAICKLQDDQLILLVLKIGPRGDVYK